MVAVWMTTGEILTVFLLAGLSLAVFFGERKREARLDELEQSIAMVLKVILDKMTQIEELKEFIPAFTINQNPLQGLFDAIAGNIQSNIRERHGRDDAGRFASLGDAQDGETKAEEESEEIQRL